MSIPFKTVQFSNSNYVVYAYGEGLVTTPVYKLVNRRTGAIVHMGKRKHIVEMWNTRYDTDYSWSAS